jgi:hypothetical protein
VRCNKNISPPRVRIRTLRQLSPLPSSFGTLSSYDQLLGMSESNCYCFRCRRSLTEINSYGQLLTGCVNCNIWWEARGPVRPHLSQRRLLALNINPSGTPDVITG